MAGGADRPAPTVLTEPFPWPRAAPCALPSRYATLRAETPVVRAAFASGEPVWLVTRHEDVRRVLADSRVSSEHSHPAFPALFPVRRHRDADGVPPRLTYSGMDPPEHTHHRRRVAQEFGRSRILRLRSRVEQIVDEQIDALEAGQRPADLVAALADTVPAAVISELLGVPLTDRPLVQRLSRLVLSHRGGPAEIDVASSRLHQLVSELVHTKRRAHTDDVVGRLIARYEAHGEFDHDQMVQLTGALLTAGHETTSSMIALGVVALLEHPDVWRELGGDRRLVGPAVEELLRYLSIADLVTARVALTDIEVGAVTIPAGEGFIALTAAANHDPAVYPRPEVLDISRDTRAHVAFGHGVHRCLGRHLARLEIEVVLDRLLHRMPALHLAAPVPVPEWPGRTVFHAVDEVVVAW
ncbi:MAG: cytochrome P450 [Chloroflexi bacterium]|nr:cytochrome P450 [Chloroflexota bacterium]